MRIPLAALLSTMLIACGPGVHKVMSSSSAIQATGGADRSMTVESGNVNEEHLSREVRHELVMLPYYGVFDNLAYKVNRGIVTLIGQVTRASLKADAENVVKHIDGVMQVVDDIQILPSSPEDDRLRMALFQAIYAENTLSRYAVQAVPPIHIIVEKGRATLEGAVATEADKSMAGMRAQEVSGVFSVNNNLRVGP